MTQSEKCPSPDDMRKVFRGMQFRMRSYALHHFDHIGPRTLTLLQDMDLFETPCAPIGAKADLDVLQHADHRRREQLLPGPLLLYRTLDEPPKRKVLELPVLLYSELPEVRKAALADLERMVAGGLLDMTPKTRDVLNKSRAGLLSDTPHAWRTAAVALNDAFNDDVLIALQGVRQSLESEPVIQDGLNSYVPRVLHPAISSLDSITLEVKTPEGEHARMTEIVAEAVTQAASLQDACARYYARLGYLPLAPAYSMAQVVSRWMEGHPADDAWTGVWGWAQGAQGPTPRYHACSVFVLCPDLVPAEKLPDLWREILRVVHDSSGKGVESLEHEPWALRRDLARHFAYHLEANLPDNEGTTVAAFAWWLADRVAGIFQDDPVSAQFYRKNWVEPAADRSTRIWLVASPRMGRSFLRYVTATIAAPWASSLLAHMGSDLERLFPEKQAAETQTQFNEALLNALVCALPFAVESPAEPTYAMECPLGATALKWARLQPEEHRKALEQLVVSSRTLGSVEGLCTALRNLAERSLPDQVAAALVLKAKAYTDPAIADGVWAVLSDAEWRQRVLGSIEERVLGLLIEAFSIIQVAEQGKWFSQLPHYIAELCEKTEDEERQRLLFRYVVHTSLASDTVSAVRRLLRGAQKAKLMKPAEEYRERVEAMWPQFPAWVQGRLRGLLANFHVV